MRRREFLLALLAAAPLARAQRGGRQVRVALLVDGAEETIGYQVYRFEARLRELGWVAGGNLVLDTRYSGGASERLPALAAELLAQRPDVAVTMSTTATLAVLRATSSLPVVFFALGDPVGSGVVRSLARPGGNATGQSIMSSEISAKWMQLLVDLVPGARRFAFLGHRRNPGIVAVHAAMQETARARGFSVELLDATTPEEVDAAFARMKAEKFDAFMVASATQVLRQRQRIVELAARHRIPGAYAREEFADAGGLLSYSVDRAAQARRTAEQLHRVLEGARPADLPVEQPSRVTLTVNLAAARAMGLTVPQPMLIRADRVIE